MVEGEGGGVQGAEEGGRLTFFLLLLLMCVGCGEGRC